MIFSGRRLLLGLSIVIVACGVVVWIRPEERWLWIVVALCGLTITILLNTFRPPLPRGFRESVPASIESRALELSEESTFGAPTRFG